MRALLGAFKTRVNPPEVLCPWVPRLLQSGPEQNRVLVRPASEEPGDPRPDMTCGRQAELELSSSFCCCRNAIHWFTFSSSIRSCCDSSARDRLPKLCRQAVEYLKAEFAQLGHGGPS